jgi:hypothetical protein
MVVWLQAQCWPAEHAKLQLTLWLVVFGRETNGQLSLDWSMAVLRIPCSTQQPETPTPCADTTHTPLPQRLAVCVHMCSHSCQVEHTREQHTISPPLQYAHTTNSVQNTLQVHKARTLAEPQSQGDQHAEAPTITFVRPSHAPKLHGSSASSHACLLASPRLLQLRQLRRLSGSR